MSYKEISSQFYGDQIIVPTLSQHDKKLQDKAKLNKKLARILI